MESGFWIVWKMQSGPWLKPSEVEREVFFINFILFCGQKLTTGKWKKKLQRKIQI